MFVFFFDFLKGGYAVIATLFVIGGVVFLHELGHFIIAKLCGVRVLQFSLGFPPKAYSKKIGETEYIISWIPLGGYVRMAGENEEINEPYSFSSKSSLEKLFIIVAGPISNIFWGIVILWLIFLALGEAIPDRASTVISGVVDKSPAQTLGLQKGDSIVAINDIFVRNWDVLDSLLSSNPGERVRITFVRGGEVIQDTVTLLSVEIEGGKRVGKLGVYPRIRTIRRNPKDAIKKSLNLVGNMLKEIIEFLSRALSGEPVLKELGGPILIAQLAGKTAKSGLGSLFIFMAILSVNLGFINLFPLPLLDGGQIIIYSIEGISRKKLPKRAKEITQKIGVFILLLLILIITVNDICRLFGK